MYDEQFEDLDDIESIMSEAPGGENHGRLKRRVTQQSTTDRLDFETRGRHGQYGKGIVRTHGHQTDPNLYIGLSDADAVERDFKAQGGWSIIYPGHGGTKGNPHGVVIDPEMYVDADELETLVTKLFGWTYSQIHYIYGHKHLTLPEDKALKAEMDAAFLEIYEAGGNIQLLTQALGMSRKTIDRAIARARKVREES